MKEKNLLTKERKKQGLSMLALSKKADVAYTTIWNLENGLEKRVSYGLKEKIAFALGKNPWIIFPDVKAAIFKRHKDFEDEMKGEKKQVQFFAEPEIKKGQALLITLESIVINLKIKEEERLFYQKVLLRMTPEELGDIFHSGTFANEAKKKIRRFAKKYKVKSL